MNNFDAWLEDADMPAKQGGEWVDLETGIPYSDWLKGQSRPAAKPLNGKALEARAVAKFFGGKALTGTRKQKEWAEKIRAKVLQSVDPEAAQMLCDPEGLAKSSKFWIENREKAPSDFAAFIVEQKGLLAQYRKLAAKASFGDVPDEIADQVREVAVQYNALTAKWIKDA